jgi:hypothetical protein
VSGGQLFPLMCVGCAAVAAATLVVAACVATPRMVRFWRRSGRADGVVADAWVSWPSGSCGDSDVVTLAIECVDADGVTRRGTVEVSQPKSRSLKCRPRRPAGRYWLVIGTPEFAVGDRVRVRYDPDRPDVVFVDSLTIIWLPILTLNGVAAGGVVVMGAVLWSESAQPGAVWSEVVRRLG